MSPIIAIVASATSVAVDVAGIALVLAIAGACWWGASHLEPHRVSRDGRSFTCRARQITITPNSRGATVGRWSEARVFLVDDGVNVLFRQRSAGATSGALAKASDDGPRVRVYALHSNPIVEFRVPTRSTMVAHLDEMVR